MKTEWRNRIVLVLKGLGMGGADIIPGVSGGTIALITGIYGELIETLSSIGTRHGIAAVKLAMFWKPESRKAGLDGLSDINWNFLLPLLSGIALAILGMSKVIPWVMHSYPYYAYSLFFGLILFSVQIPFKQTEKNILAWGTACVFAVATFMLVGESNLAAASDSLLYIFLCGATAICAMILPGISGAYILVLLGEYTYILESLRGFKISVIVVFLLGIVVGILSFVRVLRYLLENHKSITMAALTGIMAGSLRKVWPVDHLPESFSATPASQLWLGVVIIAVGATIVLILDRVTQKER